MKEVSPLRIAFLDVGHGDSIVITVNDKNGIRRAIVIDSPNPIKTRNYIRDNNIDVVDYIIITHLHKDHYSGINSLIELLVSQGIDVRNVCWEKDKVFRIENEKKDYVAFTTKLLENHQRLGIGCISKKFDNRDYKNLHIDNVEELKINIIYPNNFAANSIIDNNINNTSTVLKVEYKGIKVILPGDLEGEGWDILKGYIENNNIIECDILKIPHHGDYFEKKVNSLSTEDIINITKPTYAIISTAQNNLYKHPDSNTIKYLKKKNIDVFCTQVTDICTMNREQQRSSVLEKLNIESRNYKKNWCPCMGDIILEIDNEVKVVSHKPCTIQEIKGTFSNPLCVNIIKEAEHD